MIPATALHEKRVSLRAGGWGTGGDTEPEKQGIGRESGLRANLPTAVVGYHGNDESVSSAAPLGGGWGGGPQPRGGGMAREQPTKDHTLGMGGRQGVEGSRQPQICSH